eukprot:c9703_g1_i1.p1 GENE.c9703_g1_i1~~c9703_g1_i1.p1  ORF type:complete len:567 (-),score=107.16 c9703_g1_i1:238-1833(-)
MLPSSTPLASSTTTRSPTSPLSTTPTDSVSQTTSPSNTQSCSESVSPSSMATTTESTSCSPSGSQSRSISPASTTTTIVISSPSPSLSAVPSLVVSTVVSSAIWVDASVDSNPQPLNITTTVRVSVGSNRFRLLTHIRVYATDQNMERQELLFETPVGTNPEAHLTFSRIHVPSKQVGLGAGLLVIGVENNKYGSESTVDHAWLPLTDWAAPLGVISHLNQSIDLNVDPWVVSALVTVAISLPSNAEFHERVKGVKLYHAFSRLDANDTMVRERVEVVDILLLTEMLQQATSNNISTYAGVFDVGRLILDQTNSSSGGEASALFSTGQHEWTAVLFNDVFESGETNERLQDQVGLGQTVASVVTTASVAAVASAVVASAIVASPSSSLITSAQVSEMVSLSTGHPIYPSPILLIGNLQSIAITGSMQLTGIPANYRKFAQSFAWSNGHLKLHWLSSHSKTEYQFPDVAGMRFTDRVQKKIEQMTHAESVASNGSIASQVLHTSVIMFVLLLALCPAIYAITTRYDRPKQKK